MNLVIHIQQNKLKLVFNDILWQCYNLGNDVFLMNFVRVVCLFSR